MSETKKLKDWGCSSDTVQRAMSLYRQAKTRTGPGSGREVAKHCLLPICAYIASSQLSNQEISKSVAQAAACLKPAEFKKAADIVQSALQGNETSSKTASYSSLTRQYIHVPSTQSQIERYCHDAQEELEKLGMKAVKGTDMICSIFFWVCDTAKCKELPDAGDFRPAHSILLRNFESNLSLCTKHLSPLKKRIQEETRSQLSSHPSSPTKRGPPATPDPSTPRRSTRATPKRALLTKESVKQQSKATPARTELTPRASSSRLLDSMEDDDDDNEKSFPETPTKRRRVDLTPNASASSMRLFHATITSSKTVDQSSPAPQTPRKKGTQPSHGSPLKRTILPPPESDEDVVMHEQDEKEDEDEPDVASQSRLIRRFRPVYVDHQQWRMPSKRVRQLCKAGEKRKLEYFRTHGNFFQVSAP